MNDFFRPVELANEQTIQIDGIDTITVSYVSEAVRIYITDEDTLTLREYFSDKDPDYFAQITAEGGMLTIRHGERPWMFNAQRGHVELYLPRRYYGVLHVKAISGRIESSDRLVLGELTMSNTSGRIQLKSVTAGRAVLSAVSGAIEVGALTAMATVNTVSGSIRVGRAEGDGSYKTVSGSLDVTYAAVTGDLSASSTSGRVRLAVPALLSYELDASSVSGRIQTPLSGPGSSGNHAVRGVVGDSPQVKIRLRTVSGRVENVAM